MGCSSPSYCWCDTRSNPHPAPHKHPCMARCTCVRQTILKSAPWAQSVHTCMSFPPCQRFAFDRTILRSSILDSLWNFINPIGAHGENQDGQNDNSDGHDHEIIAPPLHLRRAIGPGCVGRFLTPRTFCRPARGLLAPPFRHRDCRICQI